MCWESAFIEALILLNKKTKCFYTKLYNGLCLRIDLNLIVLPSKASSKMEKSSSSVAEKQCTSNIMVLSCIQIMYVICTKKKTPLPSHCSFKLSAFENRTGAEEMDPSIFILMSHIQKRRSKIMSNNHYKMKSIGIRELVGCFQRVIVTISVCGQGEILNPASKSPRLSHLPLIFKVL